MSRQGLALAGATLLVAVTVTACVTEVEGTAAAPTTHAVTGNTGPATTSRPSSPPEEKAPDETSVAAPGQCIDGDEPAPVDCDKPHTVEITAAGTFGGAMAEEPPERDEVFAAVFPSCRKEAADYLGSDDYDLTTLSAWLVWAGKEAWARGERWYRCGVVELDKTDVAKRRTGSIRNALRGDGVHAYRFCSLTAPSEKPPTLTTCDRPHRGEAVALVPMGEHTEPLPDEKEFEAAAKDACEGAVIDYLGARRGDVKLAWRWPDESAWRLGFNNLTCYLETETPVTASLRAIGNSPLPR